MLMKLAALLLGLTLAVALTGPSGAQTAPQVATDAPVLASPALTEPALTEAAPLLPSAQPLPPAPDMSPMGMIRVAHPVVQAVMAVLAGASILCWTILIFKTVQIGLIRARTRASCRALLAAPSLDRLEARLTQARDPAASMARVAREEVVLSAAALDRAGTAGVKERVASLLLQIDQRATAHLRRGTGLLATIGAVAPFVGLFGTVWGIMNAFVGIAESHTTNLAVVAPGIAEALLATAIGLVAAIPAVVIYNLFARSIASYRLLLAEAAAAVARLVSRDLDFRGVERG